MDTLWALPFAKYGPSFRLMRKIAERCFRPASLAQYRAMQERKIRILTTRMLEIPQEWAEHIELWVDSFLLTLRYVLQLFSSFQGEQLLSMTYGYDIRGPEDRILDAGKTLSDIVTRVSLPGSFLVNELPFCTSHLQVFECYPLKEMSRSTTYPGMVTVVQLQATCPCRP